MASRSFAARLEALEALEAQREADAGRHLEVFLHIRPIDYFTLFEAEPCDRQACARIEAEYGLDRIDWAADRVQVSGGTWPGVPAACERTIARIQLPDGYGCRIDAAPWVSSERGQPSWCVAQDGEALTAVRRAHHAVVCAGLDLVLAALEDGQAEICPIVFGAEPGAPYGPRSYGVCMASDPDVVRWSGIAAHLMRAADVQISTVDEYRHWVQEYSSES